MAKNPLPTPPQRLTETVVKTQISSALLLGLVGAAGVFSFSLFWSSLFKLNSETRAQTVLVAASPSSESLTGRLLNQLAAYQQHPSSAGLASLTAVAEQRQQALKALMAADPDHALRVATLASERGQMPASAQSLIETATPLTGTVTVRHSDNPDGTSAVSHFLKTADHRYTLHFATDPAVRTGQTLTIASAIVLDDQALVASDIVSGSTLESNVTATAATTTAIAGAHKVAIMLFNFQDDVRQPMTVDQVRQTVFTNSNSIAAFYRETSFDQTDLVGKLQADGDVFGWYTLPMNQPQMPTDCNVESWSTQADSLAARDGFSASGYDHYVYIMPWLSTQFSVCSWAGTSDIGGNHVWINGAPNYANLRILGHEIGHNYGLDHANAYRCTDGNGQAVSLSTTCTTKAYGNQFDVMGNYPNPNRQFSTFRKGTLGWYGPADTVDVTADGTFTITSLEQSAGGTKALRVARPGASGITQYFYIEFRQPGGTFDNFSQTDPAVNGVTINLGPAYGSGLGMTDLLDMTPATTDTSSSDISGFADAALAAGQSFTDATTGITINTLSLNDSGASVSVHFGTPTCQHSLPVLKESAPMSGAAGTSSAPYYFNLASTESAPCPSETYTVTPNLPAGWTQTVTPTSLTLAPAQYSKFYISLLPPAGTPAGVYTFSETFTNAAAPGFSPTDTSSYTIIVSENIPPVVTIASPANGSTLPSRGKVTIALSASDASGITQTTIAIDGTIVKTCTTASCSYGWSMGKSITSGTHTITATARDNSPAHNIDTATITVKK